MTTLTVDLDDSVVAAMRQPDASVSEAARELIVMELYRRRAVSAGRAAQVLGMTLLDFIHHADAMDIPYFRMTESEWEAERQAAEAE